MAITIGGLKKAIADMPDDLDVTAVSLDGNLFVEVIGAVYDGVRPELGGHLELIIDAYFSDEKIIKKS